MSEFLFHYHPVHPTTWAYLSSLLLIGLFMKFGRFWSIRNLDLALLISLSPGLLFVYFGQQQEKLEAAALAGESVVENRDEAAGSVPQGTVEGSRAGMPVIDVTIPGELSTATVDSLPIDQPDAAAAAEDAVVPESGEDVAIPVEQSEDPLALPEAAADGSDEPLRGVALRKLGFIWLLSCGGLLLLRLLIDPTMVRRPLLEPNLSTGGLTFIGCFLFIFLMANVANSPITEEDLRGPRRAEQWLAGVSSPAVAGSPEFSAPGNSVVYLLPSLVTMPQRWSDPVEVQEARYVRMAKAMAILSHLAVVVGLVAIGYQHFGNIQTGIGAATLYLMLPYTAQTTGRVDHVLPAALLVWAVVCYRRPLPAGMFIGLASGVAYYPLFLLPLWISFYWQRGLMRFLTGVLSMLLVMATSMIFVSHDAAAYLANLQRMFGIRFPAMEGLAGIWGLGWEPFYRLPVLAAFVALSGALAIWPVQKNLGTLLSCSAAVMVATQFWHGNGGGLYMAWYLPLTLLTIFRPNLEDRVALTVLGVGWFPGRRHAAHKGVDIAA